MTTVHYVAVLGQSNAEALFNFYGDEQSGATELAASLSSGYLSTGASAVSAGAVRGMLSGVGTTAKSAISSNVLVENLAVGGTTADGNAVGVSPSIAWWYPDSNTPGQLLLNAIARINQVLGALQSTETDVILSVVWAQGENDAKLIMDGKSDAATYKEATTEIFARLTASVAAPFDIYMQEVGSTAYLGGDARWNGGQDIIRGVQREIAAASERVHIAAVTLDLPLRDHVHISEESYEVTGRRLADYINYDRGYSTKIPSPRPAVDPDLGPVIDQPPIARPDSIEASLAQATVAANVLTNDYDPDWDLVSVISVDGHLLMSGAPTTVYGRFGTLTIDSNGSYSYKVDTNIVRPGSFEDGNLTDVFSYVIHDEDGFSATTPLTITIVSVPDTHTIVGTVNKDNLSGTIDNDVIIALGGEDTIKGREGDDRIYGGLDVDTIEGNAGNDVIIGGAGADKLKGSAGNDIFVIRSQAEAGDIIADWGVGEVLDLTGIYAGSSPATAAALISAGKLEIRPTSGGTQVWANIDGTAFLVATITGTAAVSVGQIKVNATPLYVEDGYSAPGYGSPATPQPGPPAANADVNQATSATPTVIGNVLDNDSDPDEDALAVILVGNKIVTSGSPAIVVGHYGTLTIHYDGSYSYSVDPSKVAPGQGSLHDVFTYAVTDTQNLQDSAALTITVVAPDAVPTPQPPVAIDDVNAASTSSSVVYGNVVSNDTDAGNEVLRLVAIGGTSVSGSSSTMVSGLYGTLTISANGNYVYTVDATKVQPGQGSLLEVFSYTVADPGNLQDTGALTITITAPALQPPIAVDDTNAASTTSTQVFGNVITNDTDPTNDLLTVVAAGGHSVVSGSGVVVNGLYGTLTINADGSYTYTVDPSKVPAGQGSLPDIFNYTISDASHLQDTGALTITVSSPAPTVDDTNTDGNAPPAGAIVGTEGINRLTGGTSADRIHGLGGADTLKGGLGNDIIFGGAGADIIEGNDGSDIIFGGTGNDNIKGGAGADTIVFSDGDGNDTVVQFRRDDTIILENSYFSNKAAALSAIVAGPQAGTFVLHYSAVDTISFSDTTQVELAGAVWVFGSANIV